MSVGSSGIAVSVFADADRKSTTSSLAFERQHGFSTWEVIGEDAFHLEKKVCAYN